MRLAPLVPSTPRLPLAQLRLRRRVARRAARRLSIVLAALAFAAVAARHVPAQIGPPPAPPENPVTPAKAVLGKVLFWDEQLSSDNTVSCGTCHRPAQGGGDLRFVANPGPDGIRPSPDDLFGSPGVIRSDAVNEYEPDPVHGFLPQATARNSQTNLMAGFSHELFWDGRASSTFVDPQTGLVSVASGGALESQSLVPLVSSVEMGHAGRDWSEVTTKISLSHPLALAANWPADVAAALLADPTYADLFEAAFGDPAITAERIAFALASYQRSFVPDQTAWDAFNAGNSAALTPRQQNGLSLFTGKAGCGNCHVLGLFTDDTFRNIGLRDPATDPGRQAVTGSFADRGKMKVPSLRNAGLRRRFMHSGQFVDLTQVVGFYDRGGDFADNRDPLIVPLRLTPGERNALVDFVANGLTDGRAAQEVAPFDRPLLYTERNLGNPSLFGRGSRGAGGFEPRAIAVTPPNIGNWDFKFGLFEARGNAVALAILSLAAAPPGTLFKGIPINVDLSQIAYVGTFVTAGAGAGNGYATFVGELPDDPTLIGLELFAEWFVADPLARGGFATSAGIEFDLF